MCSTKKIPSATIIPVVAAGATTSPYPYEVYITQPLCYKTCAESTPVFVPQFSVKEVSNEGGGLYNVKMHVEGIISYVPCSGGCCAYQQPMSQDFTFPIFSTTDITSVTVTSSAPYNRMDASGCQRCSKIFKSDAPIIVTVK